MFDFTTLTVFNKIVSATVENVGDVVPKNANLILSKKKKTVNGNLVSISPTLRIGNTRFDESQIEKIYVKAPTVEQVSEVTFNMGDIPFETGETEAIVRIILYIGLSMNSQDSTYANPFVYKGKPLYVEFKAFNGNVDKTAKECKRIVEKFMLFETDEKLLEVIVGKNNTSTGGSNDTGKVTIKGVNGYQQIKKAILLKFNPNAIKVDCCTDRGDFEDVRIGVPAKLITVTDNGESTSSYKTIDSVTGEYTEDLASNQVPITPGYEAFGDYNWIIHNLRLPTEGNMSYWGANKQEMPVPGQSYTQFTIVMKDTRDKVAGEGVGMRITSVTTHVLYVAGDYTDLNDNYAKTVYTLLNTNAPNGLGAGSKIETV